MALPSPEDSKKPPLSAATPATKHRCVNPANIAVFVLILVTCALASVDVWLGPGIIQTHAGGDSPFLLQRTYELVANLRDGIFPARWMPDAAYGLGYPFFSFYASLPYYIAALINLTGFDLISAIKLTQTFGMFAAAGTMWLYARTVLPRPGALLATIAYTLAPYHLVNLYVRGDSLQEFFAFVWYPLILWGVDLLVWRAEDGSRNRCEGALLVLAIALAALALTHNVSTVIFAPFIVLYTLARLAQIGLRKGTAHPVREVLGAITRLAAAVALGLALSAWFWLPALGESSGLQLANQTTGYLDYRYHFRGMNLVQFSLLFNYQVNGALDVFAIALPQALLILAGAIWWLRNRAMRFNGVLMAILCVLATLMIIPLSKPLWDALPVLPLVQFPWRFLSVQAFFGALLIGGLMVHPLQAHQSQQKAAATLASTPTELKPPLLHPDAPVRTGKTVISMSRVIQGVLLLLIVIALSLSLPGLPDERLDVRAEDITPHTLQLFEWLSGNIGTTIRAEYLPVSAQPRPMVGPDLLQQSRHALVVEGDVISSTLEQLGPARQLWHIAVGSPIATMTIPLLYWPAWHATLVDASGTRLGSLPISPYIGSGWVMLSLPRGQHWVMLALDGTPLQQAAQDISLAALLIAAAIGALVVKAAPGPSVRVIVISAAGMLIVIIAGQIARSQYVPTPAPIQVLDYNDRQFSNRSPVIMKSAQGDTYELTGVIITPTQVQAGQVISITTQWHKGQAPARLDMKYRLPSGGYYAYMFYYAGGNATGVPELITHTVLSDALPGPLLFRLSARDAQGNIYTPTLPGGQEIKNEYLGGLSVSQPAPPVMPKEIIRTFPNGIQLRKLDWYQPTINDLCFRAVWATTRPLAAALQVSFSLRGADGHEVAHADWQPQAGLAPTWSWQAGVPVYDSDCIHNVGMIEAGEAYTLLIRWYRVLDQHSSGEVILVGTRKVEMVGAPEVPHAIITQHTFSQPSPQHHTNATFGRFIRLLGYDLLTTTHSISLTLYWTSPVSQSQDEKLFVHLAPITTPVPVRQVDRYTLDGMYPTGMWVPHEVVSETVSMDISSVPVGYYDVAIGWYDPDTLTRLPARTDAGPIPDGRYVLAKIQR